METLIYTAGLGILCMLAELFGLRRILTPLIVAGALGLLIVHFLYSTTTQSYFNDMFRTDSFFLSFGGLLIGLFTLIFILVADFFKEEKQYISDYYSILIFTLAGAIIMVGYSDLVMLFLGLEILSISLYILAGSRKTNLASNEAGMKYFLMGSFATAILLFGIALLYGATGSFNLETIGAAIAAGTTADSTLITAGMLLIFFGLFFKVSAFPFHNWSPDVYQGSPAVITLFMSTIGKIAAVAAFFRLVSGIFLPVFREETEVIFLIVIAGSLITGNVLALMQQNFKRMMAYSGISHAGYMLLALLCLPIDTSGILLYYALAYGLAGITAFGVAIAVFKARGSEDFEAFKGLFRSNRLLAIALTISMISMAGIPPLAGFWGKYMVFTGAIASGFFWITIVAILCTLVGVYYYFKVINAMLQPGEESPVKTSPYVTSVIVISALLTVVAGLAPDWVVSWFIA